MVLVLMVGGGGMAMSDTHISRCSTNIDHNGTTYMYIREKCCTPHAVVGPDAIVNTGKFSALLALKVNKHHELSKIK